MGDALDRAHNPTQLKGVRMTRKLKMLGMAFVAVLALTAVSASAASATNYTASTYGEAGTTATGTSPLGNDIFNTEGGKVECASHFEGTLTKASPELTVKAKYTSCKAFGFVNATVDMGTCDYLFTEPVAAKDANGNVIADTFNAPADVTCTTTTSDPKVVDPITITAGTCKVTIGAQTTGGSVDIKNETAAGDVKVKANITGIAYTVVTDGFGCPFTGTGAKAGATYTQGEAITFDAVSPSTATIDVG
jgi:hypothetical protein